jgi:hypothetical protein
VARKQLPAKRSLEAGIDRLKEQFAGRLKPPLDGLAYRFTIWLPVQAHGKPVFTSEHQAQLFKLFHVCCGGCSHSRLEGFPPWSGSWLPEGTAEAIVDHHILIVVYTLQDSESVLCMRRLNWLLQQPHVAAQEVVLIEQMPVQFVAAAQLL